MSGREQHHDTDLSRAMRSVAQELLGKPNEALSSKTELRFGNHGSLAVDPKAGTFFDHEAGAGGGVLDLVMRERSVDKTGAIEWLQQSKHIAGATQPCIEAVYPYTDADGAILFEVVRLIPKSFRQRRPDPASRDGYAWNMGGVERVPYRLPDVLAAVAAGEPVLIAEGEKAVEALARLGFAATCSPGGASKWRPEYGAWFSRADVVILPDNDEAGRKHARQVMSALAEHAQRVRVLELPGLPEKGDPFDWIGAGGTGEQLARLIEHAPSKLPDEAKQSGKSLSPGWPEPLDFLARDDRPAPILAAEHLPPALFTFVADTADRIGVDPAAVALSCIVAAASVITDNWRVQVKRFDPTWTEAPRLWGAIVGDPSIAKSPIITACTKPIDTLEAEARRQHAGAMRTYREKMKAAKADKTGETPEPTMPRLTRYLIEGATVESISEVLRDDDEARFDAPARKVLSRHDEMSEFFGGLDRYKAGGRGGSDRGSYLRLFNGGPYTVDRIQRGSFTVANWSACFIGGIQPGPIQRIARESADDGLLQRFLYVVPGQQERGSDRAPDFRAITEYAALFPALCALQPPLAPDQQHAQTVVLDIEAHEHREAVENLSRAIAAMPDTSPRLKSALGKWPGLFGRLALTFHLIEIAAAPIEQRPYALVISAETAQRTRAFLLEIALPHLLRADALMFATAQTGHAKWIAGWILARKLTVVATRDVARAYREFRAPEARRDLQETMASLVAIGWLEADDPDSPAKPISTWFVNPAVHTMFAEQAERERERREAAREELARNTEALRQRAA